MARRNWAASRRQQQNDSERHAAEGAQRPEPGLTPPLTHDEWMEQQIAAAEAAQESESE